MYKNIYVLSPAIQATGGTELLQQLVYKLRIIGQNALLVYTTPYKGSNVEKVFGPRYNNPYVDDIEDNSDNIMIVSEAAIYFLLNYNNIQKAVWWLSVDFYGGSFRLPADKLHNIFYKVSDFIYRHFDKEWVHFVQSEYAFKYCTEERNIPTNHVIRLSDYLSKAFIENGIDDDWDNRDNIVLYNPKKGIEFTKSLIAMASDIKFVPIIDMTSTQIVELMKRSKVYIDFGNHPGKDRIPREATICGCCIITGRRGAAANDVDIPLPAKYKYDEIDVNAIINSIQCIFDNFITARKDFVQYVAKIREEEKVFEKEVENFFLNTKLEKIAHSKSFKIKQRICRHIIYLMKFGPALFGYK